MSEVDVSVSSSNDDTTERESRDESADERLDREHEQLFHELRSIIPGAEVLFAFLLTIAFTERFEQLSDEQRAVYYCTFMGAGLALILLLAPSSFHRIRFRQRDKEAMMRAANVEALGALCLVSLSISGTVYLITDVVFATAPAIVAAAGIWLLAASLWWGYPLARRSREQS